MRLRLNIKKSVPRGNCDYFLKYSDKMDAFEGPTRFLTSSGEADFILSTDSKCFSKISFVDGPIPFI